MKQNDRVGFGTQIGIILATAGSAVGVGNIWRFPYLTGENGGAAFILIYLICMLLLGIPCMICEFIVGRYAAVDSVGAFKKLAGKTPWRHIGYVGIAGSMLILSFCSVIAGWCLHYIYASLTGELHGDPHYFSDYFSSLSGSPITPVLWAFVMVLATHFIVVRGVKNGIEKASKLMMPILLALLIVLMVCACTLPGAEKGITFLFEPDFSKVTGETILIAIGQAFFSLSIGMGVLCTYASYFRKDTNLVRSALQISLIDFVVALLSAMMIFPAAFAVGIEPDTGSSLTFITLPNIFQHAFGGVPFLTETLSAAFYLLLALASLTSLISLHETVSSYLHEEYNMSRRKAAWIVTAVCSVLCALCSLSFGDYEWLHIAGRTFFEWFDFLSGQVLILVGGLLVTLFVCWYLSKKTVRDEYTNGGKLGIRDFSLFYFCAKYICPLLIILIFLKGFGLI